jgi:hypothetical protein
LHIDHKIGGENNVVKDAGVLRKQEWVRAGRRGLVLCLDCPLRDLYGYGTHFCTGCHEAWRENDQGEIEYFNVPKRALARTKTRPVGARLRVATRGVRMAELPEVDQTVLSGIEQEIRKVDVPSETRLNVGQLNAAREPDEVLPPEEDPALSALVPGGLIPDTLFNLKRSLKDHHDRLSRAANKMESLADKMAGRTEEAADKLEKRLLEHQDDLKHMGV